MAEDHWQGTPRPPSTPSTIWEVPSFSFPCISSTQSHLSKNFTRQWAGLLSMPTGHLSTLLLVSSSPPVSGLFLVVSRKHSLLTLWEITNALGFRPSLHLCCPLPSSHLVASKMTKASYFPGFSPGPATSSLHTYWLWQTAASKCTMQGKSLSGW